MHNHYKTLKVAYDAPPEVIEMAYKALCLKFDPNKYPDNMAAAERIIKELAAAYTVLSDPDKRKDYDDFLAELASIGSHELSNDALYQDQKDKPQRGIRNEIHEAEVNTSYNLSAALPVSPRTAKSLSSKTIWIPWRRFFARFLDYTFAGLLVGFTFGLLEGMGLLRHELRISLVSPIIFGPIVCFVWLLLEPAILGIFGNTAGKMLLGLRIVTNAQHPQYFNRAFSVWIRGVGLGLPIIGWITNLLAYIRLKRTGKTSWDENYGFTVVSDSVGWLRVVTTSVAMFLVIILLGLEGNIVNLGVISEDAQTQFIRGLNSENGKGVSQNLTEAAKWFQIAAERGHAEAQSKLGDSYNFGFGVPQNTAEAAKWYRLAADQGNTNAQQNLGYLYMNGKGVPQDTSEAIRWWRTAANQGDISAQLALATTYKVGWGRTPLNYSEAAKWYRLAAEQGNSEAQTELGILYNTGQGVPQNFTEAAKWYRLAVDQGNGMAKILLKDLYGGSQ